jgi:hypothetical protein
MTIDLSIMLVVAVLCTEHSWTHGTREVVDVVFPIKGCDVRSTQSSITLVANEVQSSKVIGFAEGVLALTILFINWEEF